MAFLGLFGNYTKPGPGVSKDEPPKAAPIRFFEIYFRKFTKLCQANLIFVIPFAAVVALMVLLYSKGTHYVLQFGSGDSLVVMDVWSRFVVPIPLILLSPFIAGLTYITRNFTREEHAFVWSDFWDAVKGNWKYFLINGCIVYVVYAVLSFAMTYYQSRATEQSLFYVPYWMCILFGIIFIFAQYYLPVMFITFDLKFKQFYKNAFIFVVAGFWRNILLTVIFGVLIYLAVAVIPIINLTVFIFFLLLLFVLFSFISYLINFVVYPVVDRYMVKPYEKQQAVERGEIAPDDSDLKFRSAAEIVAEEREEAFYAPPEESESESEDDEDKYVFINGKLVKRSELKESERKYLEEQQQ